jgi:hypothetical protein
MQTGSSSTPNACNQYFLSTSETLFLIDQQQSSSVLNSGLFKIDSAKQHNHRFAEFVHRIKVGGLAHSQVLMNKITDNSICKHANSCRRILIGSEAKLTGGIGLGGQVIIVRPHFVQNHHEQLP